MYIILHLVTYGPQWNDITGSLLEAAGDEGVTKPKDSKGALVTGFGG